MSSSALRRLSIATVAVALLSAACSRAPNQPKIPLGQTAAQPSGRDGLPAEARSALDSGNAEYRAGRYDAALAAYRTASKAAPDNAAPYFGIYMVAKKLGNVPLADSATAAIASRNGANLMLSDSAMKALHATSASR